MKLPALICTLSIFLTISPTQAEDAADWSMRKMYPMTQLNAIYRTQQLNLPPPVPYVGGSMQPQQSNFGMLLQFLTNAVWACSYSRCYSSNN